MTTMATRMRNTTRTVMMLQTALLMLVTRTTLNVKDSKFIVTVMLMLVMAVKATVDVLQNDDGDDDDVTVATMMVLMIRSIDAVLLMTAAMAALRKLWLQGQHES